MGNEKSSLVTSLLDRYLEYRLKRKEIKEARKIEVKKLASQERLKKIEAKETKRKEEQAEKIAKKQAKAAKKLAKKSRPRKVSTSTKFVFFFILPVIFFVLLVSTSLILGELQLLIPAMISVGIVVILIASALKKTTSYPNFFIKKILGIYERKGYGLYSYILDKESIKTDAEIPYYKGGLAFVFFWEEIIVVFGGDKTFKNKVDDVYSPNDGVSIDTNLEIAIGFSPKHMSEALRKCGDVKNKVTEENLKTISGQFFNIAEPEFKATLKNFADKHVDSKYDAIINSVKDITTQLKSNVESRSDVQGTANGDHLVENLGVLVSKYNLEMKPDEKVETAKENITITKLNRDAAMNEISVKKDILTAIGTAIKETTGKDPSQESMTNLALSMFGNSSNILLMGNTGGKNPAIAVNTQKNQPGGKK